MPILFVNLSLWLYCSMSVLQHSMVSSVETPSVTWQGIMLITECHTTGAWKRSDRLGKNVARKHNGNQHLTPQFFGGFCHFSSLVLSGWLNGVESESCNQSLGIKHWAATPSTPCRKQWRAKANICLLHAPLPWAAAKHSYISPKPTSKLGTVYVR